MQSDLSLVECVAFILIKEQAFLVEERSLEKRVVPGALAIPGGHLDPGELPEEALMREIHEELDIVPKRSRYCCTLLHRAEEFRKLHYFAILSWDGIIQAKEADALRWLPCSEFDTLSLDVDRIAVREYARIYGLEDAANRL